MRVVEFAFIVYPATERQRSRAFYENVLQLTPAMSLDLPDGFWIEYEIGPHTLAIGKEPFLKPSGDGPHLALEVEDLRPRSCSIQMVTRLAFTNGNGENRPLN